MQWSGRGVRSSRWSLCLLGLALFACADGTRSEADPEPETGGPDAPLACTEPIILPSGEEVPCIGPGETEAPPDGEYVEPVIDNTDLEEAKERFLTQDGDGKIYLYVNETRRVGVRTVDLTGRPVEGQRIRFELVESDERNPSEALLSAGMTATNEFGVGDVQITAGPRPSFFYVDMDSDGLDGLRYQVSVIQPPEGRPVEPPDPNMPPPDPMVGCMETLGSYQMQNLYEPGRLLGDGPFQALETIHQALSDPGGLIGDLIRDRIGGIWGSVIRGAVRPVINYLYRYIIDNYAPDWLQATLAVVEDITALLTELEINGTIELGAVDDVCALIGRHRWETLVFNWRFNCPAGDDMCGRYDIPLERLGASVSESEFTARVVRNFGPVATLEIDEHSLDLNLGVAIVWFLQEYVLPARFNVGSFGELLQIVLPCDAVGDLAADYLSGVPLIGLAVGELVEEACEAAMESAGNYLTRLLTDQLSVSTFSMAGECKLRDVNGDQLADKLQEGRWTSGLEGDFSAERIQ